MIKPELNKADLAKTALKVLDKLDPIIHHYNQRASAKPQSIKLYMKDYRLLQARLKDTEQDIDKVTYRGYELVM